ncbi:hypothetical protein T439DRAFT_325084 [Meredithblackwellia eburnea MCA 4105]
MADPRMDTTNDGDDGDELALKPSPSSAITSTQSQSQSQSELETIYKIIKRQETDGLEPMYIVQLEEGGKKVRRDESQVRKSAPSLLDAFLASTSNSNPTTANTTRESSAAPIDLTGEDGDGESSDEEPLSAKKKKKTKRAKGEDGESPLRIKLNLSTGPDGKSKPKSKTSGRGDGDDSEEADAVTSDEEEEEEDAGADYEGDNGNNTAEEEEDEESPSSEEDDEEADGDFTAIEGSQEARGGGGGARFKSPKKGTRVSGRSTRFQKTFDLGAEGEEDFDVSMDEVEGEVREKRPPGRPKRAAAVASRKDDEDFIDDGEEEEEDEFEGEGEDRIDQMHSAFCSKCGESPASVVLERLQKRKKNKRGKRRAREDDDLQEDSDAEIDRTRKLGAWLECVTCTNSYHFGCLPNPIAKAFSHSLQEDHEALYPAPPLPDPSTWDPDAPPPTPPPHVIPKRVKVELDVNAEMVLPKCVLCVKPGGRRCFLCGVSGKKRAASENDTAPPAPVVEGEEPAVKPPFKLDPEAPTPLMFRCYNCKRPAHYLCLPEDESLNPRTLDSHVESYITDGQCHQCWSYKGVLEVILAWAPDDSAPIVVDPEEGEMGDLAGVDDRTVSTKDAKGQKVEIPNAKNPLSNAKYLVKWQGESYRQLEWIPHAYLVAKYQAKLSNFLARGSTVNFDSRPEDIPEDGEDPDAPPPTGAPLPDPDATSRIPVAWSTVDRILDVFYKSKNGSSMVRFQDYKKLPEEWEESIKLVQECYFKWGELPYAASTTEAPPGPEEEGYAAYVRAYQRFLVANEPNMRIPVLNSKQLADLDKPRNEKRFKEMTEQPDYIAGGKLMPFQLDGVNFLTFKWWCRKGCILADEMGLGKTVQIITFLSILSHAHGARPFLVTVPNSTLGNWVREFERWAPSMRVVPYGGDAPSRKIIENYELFDGSRLRTHVVLATYEALEKNIAVFRKVARWDVLVVDEGQRLKSGTSGLLFSALQSLNINHRVLLSGTPLNNNITELFNLLHFIDPSQWGNTAELTEKYEELTPEKVEEIREILKPYFLRRTKELVLNLPPLNEIVVPVSMTTLQRQLYRSILERNAAAIESIFQKTSKSQQKSKARKTNFNNILMELRKLLGHPYLVSPELEPENVTPAQAVINLREASAKFVLLDKMLPKLKAAGHRVLIFSQFKIMLNMIELFLGGLNMKYLRLDGGTSQLDRQRGIDAFNKEGSEYFAYLLSTRAGGVGINLTTADTVIMFDQDFNPHQDVQAIARAHRIGQKKPVRVFKLMVKGSCEEKIFHAGNKKLGLDHLIIQRIDAKEEEANEIESVLQFGAKAVFDDQEAEANAIRFTDADIDNLLTRSSVVASPAKPGAAAAFAHAKIWEVERNSLEDVPIEEDAGPDAGDADFWNNLLVKQQEAERRAKEKEMQYTNSGRGKRNRAEVNYHVDNRKRNKPSSSIDGSDDDDFTAPIRDSDDSDDEFAMDVVSGDDLHDKPKKHRKSGLLGDGLPKVPMSSEAQAALAYEKTEKRRNNIENLATVAKQFHNAQIDDLLSQARHADRLTQTRLVREAAVLVRRLCENLVSVNSGNRDPLSLNSSVANQTPIRPRPST